MTVACTAQFKVDTVTVWQLIAHALSDSESESVSESRPGPGAQRGSRVLEVHVHY